MTELSKHYRRMEERRLRGVHKWDYPYPCNMWESWPWWMRWPIAAAITLYFGGSIIAFTIGMSRLP